MSKQSTKQRSSPSFRLNRLLPVTVGIVAIGILSLSVPSSARDFAKVGLPINTPVNLYGVAGVYNRVPSTYEAWAVGEVVTPAGVPVVPPQ
ncbi:MAG: hypothetical protein HY421_01960, partial [Candidatus Kerfeldbacteria bacterium]|nr:hypothetical protein [Candidatus Kerfeldbacteria bacterium]